MFPITVQEIVRATQGFLVIGDPRMSIGEIPKGGTPAQRSPQVSTDSRALKQGDIFFALKGEKFDRHAYLEDSIKKGAALCVISKIPENLVISPSKFSALLKVKDSKRSLAYLPLDKRY